MMDRDKLGVILSSGREIREIIARMELRIGINESAPVNIPLAKALLELQKLEMRA